MSDVGVSDIGPAFSPEETAFFESGGETAIPDAGAGSAGDTGGDAGTNDNTKTPVAEKDGKEGGDKVEKLVSLSALHEERSRRKEIDGKFREAEKTIAELKGKFSIIDRLNLPVKEEPKPLTAEEDIFGVVKQTGESVAQLQKRLDDADATKAANEKAANENTAFVNNYKADAAKFEVTKPDFKQAYDFILNSRAAELKAIGYDTPEALHNALVADEYAIAQMAFSKGKSPAEMLYALATQRGYKTAEAKEPGKGAEKLDTIERGQNANKSLSATGGSAGDADMTAATLIAMPMDQFEAWCEKNPAKAKRLMGG